MKSIEAYSDICFDTYMIELEKVSKPLIHYFENQLALHYITGEKIKPAHISKNKMTGVYMCMMSLQMVIDGRYN